MQFYVVTSLDISNLIIWQSEKFIQKHKRKVSKMQKIIYFVMYVFGYSTGMEFSKMEHGIPVGFLGDCPGVLKPAIILPKTLEKLTISVVGSGNVLTANFTTYNYYGVEKLVKHPDIDFKKKTFIFFPGYLESIQFAVGRTMASLYKELGYNALVIDYLHFTANNFPRAVRLLRPLAKHIAEMLVKLSKLGVDPKTTELVGFSLGGQAMSLTAKHYRQMTGQNISSLTAIDPTGPCHRHLGPDQRLDPSDGDFVLQITTNMDGFGTAIPGGQVTIFVNGGEFQPADLWVLPCLVICSHIRSYLLWLSALINPGIFIALKCDSVQQARDGNCYERQPRVTNTMDLFTDRNKPGIYYLNTFYRYPYGIGKRGLKRKDNEIVKQFKWVNEEEILRYR